MLLHPGARRVLLGDAGRGGLRLVHALHPLRSECGSRRVGRGVVAAMEARVRVLVAVHAALLRLAVEGHRALLAVEAELSARQLDLNGRLDLTNRSS
eukprot:COSAG06_NODE_2446_length_6864_cov_26.056467_6_plen_97_part_00